MDAVSENVFQRQQGRVFLCRLPNYECADNCVSGVAYDNGARHVLMLIVPLIPLWLCEAITASGDRRRTNGGMGNIVIHLFIIQM